MQLGFFSATFANMDYKEVIQIAENLGLHTIEFACWPPKNAEKCNAGVCHIDANRISCDEDYCHDIVDYSADHHVQISSLGYYSNMMDSDLVRREENIAHLKQVILASERLGIGLVTTFLGRIQRKTLEENLRELTMVWPPLLQYARENGVRIAIENSPILLNTNQWSEGHNLMTTPEIWRNVFQILPDSNLGINFDPSHFVWQMIDYICPIYEFRERIWHIHCKDMKVHFERLAQVGTMAYPLTYATPKLPGLGDINWARFISALTDVRYHGPVCIEIEDHVFEHTSESLIGALRLSKRYLENYII